MSKEGRWQCCSRKEPFPSDTDMVVGGEDQHGNVIYVVRAPHAGDMIPAKVIPGRKAAYVCYAGVEIKKNNFEVLLSGKYEWKNGSNGSVPESALQVGQTNMGEPLYMGRAIYNGLLTPGKVHPSHSCCYLPCKGKEVSVTDYEVLCIRHNHCLERELDTETLDASTDTDEEAYTIGVASHAGDMISAKVIPGRKAAYVCYAGVGIAKNTFKMVLSENYEWKNGSNGSVPESALQVGQTNMGEPLYMGRAIYNGLLTPGKVRTIAAIFHARERKSA